MRRLLIKIGLFVVPLATFIAAYAVTVWVGQPDAAANEWEALDRQWRQVDRWPSFEVGDAWPEMAVTDSTGRTYALSRLYGIGPTMLVIGDPDCSDCADALAEFPLHYPPPVICNS